MNLDMIRILALANALSPIVEGGIVTGKHLLGALKGAGLPDEQVDDDLHALIAEALAAKADADRAAAGEDVR